MDCPGEMIVMEPHFFPPPPPPPPPPSYVGKNQIKTMVREWTVVATEPSQLCGYRAQLHQDALIHSTLILKKYSLKKLCFSNINLLYVNFLHAANL